MRALLLMIALLAASCTVASCATPSASPPPTPCPKALIGPAERAPPLPAAAGIPRPMTPAEADALDAFLAWVEDVLGVAGRGADRIDAARAQAC